MNAIMPILCLFTGIFLGGVFTVKLADPSMPIDRAIRAWIGMIAETLK